MSIYKAYLTLIDTETEEKSALPFWLAVSRIDYNNFFLFMVSNQSLHTYTNTVLFFNLFKYRDSFNISTINNNLKFDNEVNNFDAFLPLRKSTFTSFFIENEIDVPTCFTKSHSLRRKTYNIALLRFVNFFMKKGKKEKAFNIITSVWTEFLLHLKNENLLTTQAAVSWVGLYLYLSNSIFYKNKLRNFSNLESWQSQYKKQTDRNTQHYNVDFFTKNFLFLQLTKITPIFNFFVYSVDKNIRKYSRGKSGKYTFVWKYIAPYKRIFIAFKWIIKDMKFNTSIKVSERVFKTFEKIFFTPQNTFVWRSHVFAHNYVFRNYKKSLVQNLRTIT